MPAVLARLLRPGVALSEAEVALAAVIAVLAPVDIPAGQHVRALIEVGTVAHLASALVRLRITIVRPRAAIVRRLADHVGRCLRALVASGILIAGVAVESRRLVLRGRSVAARLPVVRGRPRGVNRAVLRLPVRVPPLSSPSAVGRVPGRFKLPALVGVPLPFGISALIRVRAPLGLHGPVRQRQRLKLPAITRRRQRLKLPVLARLRQRQWLPALIWIPRPRGTAAVVRVRALPSLPMLAGQRQRPNLAAIVRVLVRPDRSPLVGVPRPIAISPLIGIPPPIGGSLLLRSTQVRSTIVRSAIVRSAIVRSALLARMGLAAPVTLTRSGSGLGIRPRRLTGIGGRPDTSARTGQARGAGVLPGVRAQSWIGRSMSWQLAAPRSRIGLREPGRRVRLRGRRRAWSPVRPTALPALESAAGEPRVRACPPIRLSPPVRAGTLVRTGVAIGGGEIVGAHGTELAQPFLSTGLVAIWVIPPVAGFTAEPHFCRHSPITSHRQTRPAASSLAACRRAAAKISDGPAVARWAAIAQEPTGQPSHAGLPAATRLRRPNRLATA